MVIDKQVEIKKKFKELLRIGYRGHFRRVAEAVLADQQLNKIKIRYHYLKLFVEAASPPSEGWVWLLRILTQYNREERAILLLLMYLPLDNEGTFCFMFWRLYCKYARFFFWRGGSVKGANNKKIL
jgi:hypothetical protein